MDVNKNIQKVLMVLACVPFIIILHFFSLVISSYDEVAGVNVNVNVSGNIKIKNFSIAKRILNTYFLEHFTHTFYCFCPIVNKNLVPCLKDEINKKFARAIKLEWEHLVPASRFGSNFQEYYENREDCLNLSSRACVSKTNDEFNLMAADLYNLRPSVGYVNVLRSDKEFKNEGEHSINDIGCVDVVIGDSYFIPSDIIKGDIARVYLYFDLVYSKFVLTGKERLMYNTWNELDPPDVAECEFSKLVEQHQGNKNPFIVCD